MSTSLQSYVCGKWALPASTPVEIPSAIDGSNVAKTGSGGIDFAEAVRFARDTGGRNLRTLKLLQRLFDELAIDTVIDVGGNGGQYGRYLRDEIGYRGRIESFEPASAAFARLKQTSAGDLQWRLHQLALGNETRQATLNIMAEDSFSSLSKPSLADTAHYRKLNAVARTETVQVRRLRDVFDGGGNVFLKSDTQGHDLDVLDGADLTNVAAVQIEIPALRIYEGIRSLAEHVQYMQEAGFDICGMFPAGATISLGRAVDFDGVFVNRSRVPAQSP